jgi:6-phosphogluconolactonase (cycloisomerase 2 family)
MTLMSVVGTNGIAASVVVDPAGRFAYVATNNEDVQFAGENAIRTYAINPNTGFLTEVPGSPFHLDRPGYPDGMTIHPSGKFLYVVKLLRAEYGNSFVLAYSIDPTTGLLTQIPGSPYPTGTDSSSATTDPAGKFLFVTDETPCDVIAYSIDANTGVLTAVPGSPFATACPNSFLDAVDPTGRFLYVTNGNAGEISGYNIEANTGTLTAVPGSPFPSSNGSSPYGIAIHPSGHFLYVANQNSNNVSGYEIDPVTGALSPLPGSPFPEGGWPFYAAIDPTGNFLYVSNLNSNSVSAYTIAANTGALTPVLGSPFAAGTQPLWIAFASEPLSSTLTLQPTSGGNAGSVTTTIFGSGFTQGTAVNLACSGQHNIPGTNVAVGSDAATLTSTFNLKGASSGKCDVVVTKPNGTTVTNLQAFTVEQGGAPQIWMDIIGLGKIRAGREQTYYITYGNRGDVDAYDFLLTLSAPNMIQLNVGCFVPGPDQIGLPLSGVDWCQTPLGFQSGSNTYVPIWVYKIPAGGSLAQEVSLNLITPPAPLNTSFSALSATLAGYSSPFASSLNFHGQPFA